MSWQLDSTAPLGGGGAIPRLGLGVFRAGSSGQTARAVSHALSVGYRHVDTAAVYGNEDEVGLALRESDVPRDQVFVTTKLWNADHGYDAALRAFDASLARLGLDHVDLYLIHWPVEGKRLESWQALEKLHADGRARAIGVSNYMTQHLEELLDVCTVKPAANQIELHPFVGASRAATVEMCRAHDIAVVAYSPLTKGRHLDDPELVRIAAEVDRSVAQVLIRWSLQRGFVCIPKSSNPGRIADNAAVFDFTLGEEHLAALDALDRNLVTAWDPTNAP